MRPIFTLWPLCDWRWKMKLHLVINALEHSASPSLCPFPQMAKVMIWWIILFKVLYDVHIFSVCVFSVCFSLRTLTLSCGISVESKTVFSSLCLWMWQSRGACMCNMVLTFGSLLGRDNHSHFIFSRAMGGLSSKDGYLQIPFPIVFFTLPWYW